MKKFNSLAGAFILFLFIFPFCSYSQQCANCTISISGVDTSDYTVSSGQTLCIPTGTLVKGHITLSGGTVCVEGVLASAPSGGGTLNNYGTVNIASSFNLSGISITNNSNAAFNVAGDFNVSSGSFMNEGTLNVTSNISVAGTLTNNGTINFNQLSNNGGTYTNSGTANCCGN